MHQDFRRIFLLEKLHSQDEKLHIEVQEIRIEFTSEISNFIPLVFHGRLGLLGSALVETSGFPDACLSLANTVTILSLISLSPKT